jgi:hypothetical protein
MPVLNLLNHPALSNEHIKRQKIEDALRHMDEHINMLGHMSEAAENYEGVPDSLVQALQFSYRQLRRECNVLFAMM